MKDQRVVLGVDRLDYTKGLVQRIKAFERLLELHPEYLERVILMQIAVPSRTDVKEYRALKEEIDQLIGRINGRFSTADWSPIRYIYGCISQVFHGFLFLVITDTNNYGTGEFGGFLSRFRRGFGHTTPGRNEPGS